MFPRKRFYTTRDLFEEAEEVRQLPVSEYAAKLIDSISKMRGIPPQQVLDEILAYWHAKGEIETELTEFVEKFSTIEFNKLTPEAVQVLAMFLWIVEWFNKQQALNSLRLLNLTQMIQPITIYQQPPAPSPAPAPTPSPTPVEAPPAVTYSPSIIPPELQSKLEEVIREGYSKYIEKIINRLSGAETTDVKRMMMDEMMPMVKQMVNVISTTLQAILMPKQQQQIETRPPSEEEKKILEQLD